MLASGVSSEANSEVDSETFYGLLPMLWVRCSRYNHNKTYVGLPLLSEKEWRQPRTFESWRGWV
jgi:hypothetical protein